MLSESLLHLRTQHELTQAEVAKKAKISRIAYRNLETGESVPRPETLKQLAQAFGVSVHELMTPRPSLKGVRFRAQKAMKRRGQVLADVARWLHSYNELEDLVGEHMPYRFEGLTAELISIEPGRQRGIEAAQAARRILDLREREPIYDICGLLAASGIKIYPLVLESDTVFGLSVAPSSGGPAIGVNVWDRISVERWIFTAAHELAHLILHPDSYNVEETQEIPLQDVEANAFASYFLMPDEAFRASWGETSGRPFVERVLKVKRIFRVSYRNVIFRLINSGDGSPDLWRQFQTEFRRQFGKTLLKTEEPEALAADSFYAAFPEAKRSQEPSELTQWDFVEDRLRRLVRLGIEQESITLSRGAELLGIKLSHMRELAAAWWA